MSPEHHILFDRWVIVPLSALRAIPRGDGAFAALSMSFGLYERFLASRIHSREGRADEVSKYDEASADFDGKVSAADFKCFWEMYRVGLQHYFHPKHFTKGSDQTRWGWDISEHESYKDYPVIVQKEADLFVITINPWAFADHVIRRWYEFPSLMNELSATKLGEIRLPDSPPNACASTVNYGSCQPTSSEDRIPGYSTTERPS